LSWGGSLVWKKSITEKGGEWLLKKNPAGLGNDLELAGIGSEEAGLGLARSPGPRVIGAERGG